MSVKSRRAPEVIGEHIGDSLGKGDRILILGTDTTDPWADKDTGDKRTMPGVLINAAGPSLRWSAARWLKAQRTSAETGHVGSTRYLRKQRQQGLITVAPPPDFAPFANVLGTPGPNVVPQVPNTQCRRDPAAPRYSTTRPGGRSTSACPPGYQADYEPGGINDFGMFEWLDDDTVALEGSSGRQAGRRHPHLPPLKRTPLTAASLSKTDGDG